MTKMAILGRGSMRDKAKEEEWRNTLDPKYSHLSEELHVEIAALAPPAEAHARIAFALAELRKYLVPDSNDEIRLEQLREIQGDPGRRGAARGRAAPPPPPRGAGRALPGGPLPPPPPRAPSKAKVLSILDRARQAMEEPAYPDFEESPYGYEPPPPAGFGGDYNGGGSDYYDGPAYSAGGAAGRWKGYKSAVAGRGYGVGSARPAPYSRPVPK